MITQVFWTEEDTVVAVIKVKATLVRYKSSGRLLGHFDKQKISYTPIASKFLK